jgi:integrase
MRAHTARCELAEDPFLFSADPAGLQPWSPDPVSKRFKRLWARTGAPHARLHDLRHFHATDLVEAGVPITVIQKRLGHSNVSVTSRYAHSREEADEAAAEAYEARRRAR